MTAGAAKDPRSIRRSRPHHATRRFPCRFDQLGLIREFVEEAATEAPLDDARRFNLQVAVSEASANAIEHGSSSDDIEVSAARERGRFIVTVSQPGAFRPRLADDPTRVDRGMGLPLMLMLTNELTVSCPKSGGTKVSLSVFID